MINSVLENYLVKLNNADVALSGHKVLHAINWSIEAGQHWRIDGDNGAGKTTLLKTIAGLLWPVAKQPPSRLYGFNNLKSHLLVGVKNQIGYASYAMQDEYLRGSRNIICHEVIASGFQQNIMIYDRLSQNQAQAINKFAEKLELAQLLERSFLSISHGQKSAVLFARALIHQPRLLILDEIFNGIDQQRFDLMIELLREYKHTGGQIILSWHEHGIAAVEQLFTHRLVLADGKVLKISNIKDEEPKTNMSFDVLKNSAFQIPTGEKLIELKKLDVYLQNKHILKNINWTIHRGERWWLRGENGAGKTTLLKALLAELRPAIGSIIWRRGFNERSSVWQIRKFIGYVSPELQQAYRYNVSVFDAVASGFFSSIGVYDRIDSQQKSRVDDLLVTYDLVGLATFGVHQISSGQMRRVLIARAMVQDPEILIFDEITANLDQKSRSIISAIIEQLAKQGKTMIFAGHHGDAILALANRVLVMADGQIQQPENIQGISK